MDTSARKDLASYSLTVMYRYPFSFNLMGDDAFMLYTSFGFPVDLTELMAEEQKVVMCHCFVTPQDVNI
eukprot:6110579-Amphidinium_carterae.1